MRLPLLRRSTAPSRVILPSARRAGRRGQSLVEFALVAPLFFFLAFGMVDFGRAIYYENMLTSAAREGARIAILPDNPCNTIYGTSNSNGSTTCSGSSSGTGTTVCGAIRAQAAMVGTWSCTEGGTLPATGSPDTAYVQVEQYPASNTPCTTSLAQGVTPPSTTTPRSGGNLPILVTIRYYYRPLTPFISNWFPASYYLSSTSCVRAEY